MAEMKIFIPNSINSPFLILFSKGLFLRVVHSGLFYKGIIETQVKPLETIISDSKTLDNV